MLGRVSMLELVCLGLVMLLLDDALMLMIILCCMCLMSAMHATPLEFILKLATCQILKNHWC